MLQIILLHPRETGKIIQSHLADNNIASELQMGCALRLRLALKATGLQKLRARELSLELYAVISNTTNNHPLSFILNVAALK